MKEHILYWDQYNIQQLKQHRWTHTCAATGSKSRVNINMWLIIEVYGFTKICRHLNDRNGWKNLEMSYCNNNCNVYINSISSPFEFQKTIFVRIYSYDFRVVLCISVILVYVHNATDAVTCYIMLQIYQQQSCIGVAAIPHSKLDTEYT